jgi:hypothetical protein
VFDGAPEGQEVSFRLVSRNTQATSLAEIIVCNSFVDAEIAAFELFPNIVPIGPLYADHELRKPVGQFLQENTACLKWLDTHPDRSVVYVAFGSFAIFDPRQFRELAEGLELTGRPFLWVVRPDFTSDGLSKDWFDEFQDRVAVNGRGMIVTWCPQQQVCYIIIGLSYYYANLWASGCDRDCSEMKFLFVSTLRFWRTELWRASCRTAVGTLRWRESGTACQSCAGPTSWISSQTGATSATSGGPAWQ